MTKLHLKFLFLGLVAIALLGGTPAYAHCDTMSGPVVRAARRALDVGDLSQALRWVRPQDEAEVQQAFTTARAGRALSPAAKQLADRHFFETVVRLHRASEGEPYTGLKDSPPEPRIAAADQAIETGDLTPLTNGVTDETAHGIRQRFVRVQQTSRHADENLAAGREYVRAYVDFMHFVEEAGPERTHAEQHAAIQASSGDSAAAPRIDIVQFTAAKTRLKKKGETKLTLALSSDPDGAHIGWELGCSGVAITGWDAPQLLSVAERTAGSGTIQAIEAHDYIITANKQVVIVVKRSGSTPEGVARCTVRLQRGAAVAQERSIDFDLR